MEDSVRINDLNKSSEMRVIPAKNVHKSCLIASSPTSFSKKTLKCTTSMKQGVFGSGAVIDIGVFLLTTAALEIVRRFSRAKCPFLWRGLQALQVLCYPPFRWINRWYPFKSLIKNMQGLSRPMLVLSIATAFSDQPSCYSDSQSYPDSPSETPSQLSSLDTRYGNEVPKSLAHKKWLLDLQHRLDEQGITLPDRLDEDELYRFYVATNGEFSRFIASVKKTINWRQTYTFLSLKELEVWSRFVFWHSYDVKMRPCLIIRLGLACANLSSNNRPLFAKAVISQIEYGVMNLVDAKHPQITVLMDCKGLSPFGFPMKMMRSCAILLQDHYPRRLSYLIVIRLPAVSRVITQALFQVLKPATRQKMRIVGENYLEFLSEFLQTLPIFLGGTCTCSKCSDIGDIQDKNGEIIQMISRANHSKCSDLRDTQNSNGEIIQMTPKENIQNAVNVHSPNFFNLTDNSMDWTREQVIRTVFIAMIMMWVAFAFTWGMKFSESLPHYYWQSGS